MLITIKAPNECSEDEIRKFKKFILLGGEVQDHGLVDLIQSSKALIWIKIEDETVGIAGIKCPRPEYKQGVFARADVRISVDKFPLELGWVYISELHRGNKYSRPLIKHALDEVRGSGVYATSRTDQVAMHRTLHRFGFMKVGIPWPSNQNLQNKLLLFIREDVETPSDRV